VHIMPVSLLLPSIFSLVFPLLHQTCSWGLFPHDSKKVELTHSRSEDGVLLLYGCYLCWWRNVRGVPRDPHAEDVVWRLGPSVWPSSFLPFLPKGMTVECRKEAQTAATQVKKKYIKNNKAIEMLMVINVC